MISFILRRLVAQRLLALAILVTLGFSIGVLVAGPIYADAARGAILSSQLAQSTVPVKNLRIATYATEGFPYTKADRDAHAAVSGLPVGQIIREGRAPTTIRLGKLSRGQVPLVFRDGAENHLQVKGRFPTSGLEAAIDKGLAQALGIKLGSIVTVGSPSLGTAELRITGIYPPNQNSTSDYWYGTQNPFLPPDVGHNRPSCCNPLFVPASTYPGLAGRLKLTGQYFWDTYLDLSSVTYGEATRVVSRIQAIHFPDESPLSHATLQTGLVTLMDSVRVRTANLRVPVYLVAFQIGAVALAVLAGVASLALSRQSFELAVLRSRGFSKRRLLVAQAVQTVVVTAAAYPLGLVVGLALARLATHANGPAPRGTTFPLGLSGQALVAGAVGAVVAAVILLLLSLPVISRTVVEERRQLSREARPLLARVPVELFVLPIGIAAFYEVKTRGFLPVTESGSLDPLVVLAPTLLIFAGSFLVLRLLLFVLRRLERPIGRTRSLPAYLAGRRLGRSPGTSFSISLLLVLAVGLLVVSTSYRATIIRNHEDSAHQDIGADWQLQVAAPAQPLPVLSRMPPGTTPIIRTDLQVNATFAFPPSAIAIDPATYASGGWWRPDYSSTPFSEILSRLSAPPLGVPVPEEATGLQMRVEAPRQAAGLRLEATYLRADGRIETALLREDGSPAIRTGKAMYRGPTGSGGRLLSIVVGEPGVRQLPRLTFAVRAAGFVNAGGGTVGPVPLDRWQPLEWRSSAGSVVGRSGSVVIRIRPGSGHVVGGVIPPEPALPALVSTGVASAEGARFRATIGGETFQLRAVAQARGFPSVTSEFAAVPLRALLVRLLRVPEPALAINEVWAMGNDPRHALQRAGFDPAAQRSASTIIEILSQLPQSLAVGMHFTAAAGGMGLVVIGVAVGLYFTQRRREFEFASLRAMGSRPRQVTAVLATEQGLLVGFAVAAGLALGYGVVRLMMPYLGNSFGSSFPAPVLVLDWNWLGIYGAAVFVASVLGLALALRALLRSPVTSVLRGEAE